MSTATSIAVFLAILLGASNAIPYSKYGRTCKDIGCRSDEVCTMAEDPCSHYQTDSCGRYPTCTKSSNGGESCTTKNCPGGTYCKTENGRPTCVSTNPSLAPAARKPPGYDRPYASPRPIPTTRPTPPTPPPRGSSTYGGRYSGQAGNRNSIGSGSIWDRLFGGGGSDSRTRPMTTGGGGYSSFDRTTSRSPSTYGGRGYYDSHVTTDSKGNRQWTFSG